MQFINIGYGNLVSSDKILCMVSPDSAPIKRLVTKAKEENVLIDASQGRKTKGVIVLSDGRVVLSALLPETIASRMSMERNDT
ncbi:MAG: DUF370 domain-containing protein [Lachnospiraceae bacterium]|nr:DUF370 domain-containing protein [Lachnospiraceae bacterium]MBQ2577308.1 DUF370 domain-containing protein [Lachnospiraceae bacterium]MBQ5485721.1 DUF370 domain-containing protein [Lachnospiraceae bacterium]MCR4733185.1 DUF370 domain-containing protein [Lachnospiraceae bacterium]MEE3355399.1 extracellular matrix/biofilm biosynthesis regulator RemA family protein [Candidatus Weimeria sp.]